MSYPRIAETSDVRFQPLEIGHAQLTLRGLLFHSAIVVENVQIIDEAGAARILIEMAPARSGKSGSFTISVPLSENTQCVTFGQAKAEIWARAYRFQ